MLRPFWTMSRTYPKAYQIMNTRQTPMTTPKMMVSRLLRKFILFTKLLIKGNLLVKSLSFSNQSKQMERIQAAVGALIRECTRSASLPMLLTTAVKNRARLAGHKSEKKSNESCCSLQIKLCSRQKTK